ncbi:hypothetical protein AOY69_05220 [Escherichia coli]|nr:hypothetical protein [Escherichia coli]UMS75787.1 hypothetical protein AOY69_05220 [Escherichia coli]
MVCVVGRIRDLILQLSKSSIYSTKPLTVREETVIIGITDHDKVQHACHPCMNYVVFALCQNW